MQMPCGQQKGVIAGQPCVAGQVLLVPLHVVGFTQLDGSPGLHTVPAGTLASAGQVGFDPVGHTSCTSHVPADTRQT